MHRFDELGDGGSPLPDVLEYFAFRITGHVGVVAGGLLGVVHRTRS